MIGFGEFVETPYFTALEILIVILCAQLILLIIGHSNNFPTGIDAKKVNAIYLRTKFWLKHINRFPRPAIDVRRAWSVKRADKEFKVEASMPRNVLLGTLPMIANLGPVLLVNLLLNGKVVLRWPFEIPVFLRSLLQYGLPAKENADNHLMSAFGLYFLLNSCASLVVAMIPMANKRKEFYGPSSNYQNYSDMLVTERHKWELDNAEDELLELIDKKL